MNATGAGSAHCLCLMHAPGAAHRAVLESSLELLLLAAALPRAPRPTLPPVLPRFTARDTQSLFSALIQQNPLGLHPCKRKRLSVILGPV